MDIDDLKKIIELMPGNVYWKDRQGKYLGCNANLAKIIKINSCAEIVGKTVYNYLIKDSASTVEKVDDEIMQQGVAVTLEEDGLDFNGEVCSYLTKKVVLYKNEQVVGLLGISVDITERKKIEKELHSATCKAEAANNAKSQFLAIISHELRVPLTGLISIGSLLEHGDISQKELQEFGKVIIDSGNYLLSSIESILAFAKLETHKFETVQSLVDLKAIIKETVSTFKVSAKAKNLDLLIDYQSDAPHNIITDPHALRHIFFNLIDNAIKYTDQGHVLVKVTCLRQTAYCASLEILVEDTGIGISLDNFEIIFDKFTQLEDAYQRKSSRRGTGLGLSIARKLTHLLKGKISVKSEIGKGSTFSITAEFPLQTKSIKKT